jgi:hypothetical protein
MWDRSPDRLAPADGRAVLDIRTVVAAKARGQCDRSAEDATLISLGRPFLRPIYEMIGEVHGDPDAVSALVLGIVGTDPGAHQHLNVTTVSAGAHHPHAFAIAPVYPTVGERDLLGRDDTPVPDDQSAVRAIQVATFNRSVRSAPVGPHIAPIDTSGDAIDLNAVRRSTQIVDQDAKVGPIQGDRVQARRAGLEHEQARLQFCMRRCHCSGPTMESIAVSPRAPPSIHMRPSGYRQSPRLGSA